MAFFTFFKKTLTWMCDFVKMIMIIIIKDETPYGI